MRRGRAFKTVNLRDVRVVECGEQFRFALKSRDTPGIAGDIGGQYFDGQRAPQIRVGRAVHLAHAALAYLGGDFVRAEPSAREKCHAFGPIVS